MRLILSAEIEERIVDALLKAGPKEIGGVLMGEHVGADVFRVVDVTIQVTGGTFAAFVRLVEGILGPLKRFFDATNHDYSRFNYIGEWHSHHSFALSPSRCDERTIRDMLRDPELGARFVALMLVRLSETGTLETALTVYTVSGLTWAGTIAKE